MVTINDFATTYMCQSLPFGGVKESGFGRFAGVEGLRALCVPVAVCRDRCAGPCPRTAIAGPSCAGRCTCLSSGGEMGWRSIACQASR